MSYLDNYLGGFEKPILDAFSGKIDPRSGMLQVAGQAVSPIGDALAVAGDYMVPDELGIGEAINKQMTNLMQTKGGQAFLSYMGEHPELADNAIAASQVGEVFGLKLAPLLKAGGMGVLNETVSPRTPMTNQAGMLGYHGSPHKFDKFDHSKMGSGEGAQAYGWGTYIAENPDVARGYQASISSGNFWEIDGVPYHDISSKINSTPHNTAAQALTLFKGDKNQIESAAQWLDKRGMGEDAKASGILRNANSVKKSSPSLYEVDLPDEKIAQMLDWDKPLSEQPDIMKVLPESLQKRIRIMQSSYGDKVTGRELYDVALPDEIGKGGFAATPEQSSYLKEAGITGIKYLDGNSRSDGVGTRNFVVFDEKDMTIVSRNGEKVSPTLDFPDLVPDNLVPKDLFN